MPRRTRNRSNDSCISRTEKCRQHRRVEQLVGSFRGVRKRVTFKQRVILFMIVQSLAHRTRDASHTCNKYGGMCCSSCVADRSSTPPCTHSHD